MHLAALPPQSTAGLAQSDPTPIEQVRQRLDGLCATIASQPSDLGQVLALHDQADVLATYLTGIRAARGLLVDAAEARLRCERLAGRLLLQHVRLGNSRSHLWRLKRTGPPRGGRAKLKAGVLGDYGLTAKLSTAYQAVARLDGYTFEAELQRRRQAGTPASRMAMLRLVDGLSRPRVTQKSTDTARVLRYALNRLQRVRSIVTAEELELAQQVARIGQRWGGQVFRQPTAGPRTEMTCLMCAHALVARRCECGGWWTEVPRDPREPV
ncbi:MAG: hypothetical protein JOZ87_23495 [Chloroflexi bacterium]|nr:hypothetical protein [Chloroflexota bacterium]